MSGVRRYFTLDQANRMIPELEAAFVRLVQLRVHMRGVYQRLERSGCAPDDEEFEIVVEDASSTDISERAQLKVLMATFRDQLDGIERTGCVVKGVEPALVDWWAHGADGQDIFLCWRIGEKSVDWWHDPESGFAGRRPIEELPPLASDDTAH